MRIKNCSGLIAIFIFCFSQYAFSEEKKLAPDFTLQDLSQNTLTLSSYRDKQPVMLLFWTTWCPYCRSELKTLKDNYETLKKDGVGLLAIDSAELPAKVGNFIKNYNLPFRVFLDQDGRVAGSYGILGVPTYIYIDKKGHVVSKGHYFSEEMYKELIIKLPDAKNDGRKDR